MRAGVIRQAVEVEGLWRVDLSNIEYEVSANQLVEQLRGEESLAVWEVLGEQGSSLVLGPTGQGLTDGFLTPRAGPVELQVGDALDFCVGGRVSHLGLGDVIAGITKAVGIAPCQACEERRQKLNRLFPKFIRK